VAKYSGLCSNRSLECKELETTDMNPIKEIGKQKDKCENDYINFFGSLHK